MPITNANTLSALTIPRAVASNLIGALSSKDNIYSPQRDGAVIFDQSTTFEDGMSMAIQVIYCQHEPSWCQAVLFDREGVEVDVSDVSSELLGCWSVNGYTTQVSVLS
jgi:hypothetical protein